MSALLQMFGHALRPQFCEPPLDPPEPREDAQSDALYGAVDAIDQPLHLTPAERSWVESKIDTMIGELLERRARDAEDGAED